MSVRILAVEHQQSCPAALLGDWLLEAGAELRVVRPYLGEDLPEPASYDALLVLGGDMGANDDATVPWLAEVRERIASDATAGTPVLGICLGHQLVAAALGGTVGKNPAGLTVGVEPVVWDPAVADDPLFAGLVDAERVVHWNADVVTSVPDGTTPLARTVDGSLQVARFAPTAWGIQAHPEVDGGLCRRWAEVDRDDHLARGLDQDALLAGIEGAGPSLEGWWRPLAERFVELVRTGARPGSAS